MIIREFFYTIEDSLNKLFCTFSKEEDLDFTIYKIENTYSVLFSKIFVLKIENSEEFVCTYNIDVENTNQSYVLPGTILMHRRKETDTLYTINSLNALIIKLNGGVLDKSFKINWADYKNSILLTRSGEFVKLNTEVSKIVITQ